jgi:endonuclease I
MQYSLWLKLITGLLLMNFAASQAKAEGTFSLSTEELPDFREVYAGYFSDVQFYYVNGSELSQNLEINAEGPFSISLHCYDDFDSSLSLTPSNGSINDVRVYVRFFPQATGQFQGSITHQAGSVGPLTISLSGRGIESLIPGGYYNNATSGGSRLKTQLHNIIKYHQTQTYSSLWQHFEQTDATFSGKVWDMYSDVPCQEPPYIFTFVEDQDQGSGGNTEGDVFNREHSMPRSWFGGQVDPMNTDLFHIWPADKWVNAQRADYPYGEVNNPSWTSLNGGKLGTNAAAGYTGTAFEPIDAYKGDVARGFLYMITRYQDQIESWTYNANGLAMLDNQKYPGYKSWVISMLMQWHINDPVSQKEILRNQAIYQIQGNRNPFIDHPEFVERIWGDTTVTVALPLAATINIYPNPASDWVMVSTPADAFQMDIYSLCGKKIISKNALPGETRLNTSGLPPGVYFFILQTIQGTFREKLIIIKP